MKYTTFPNPIFELFHTPYARSNLYPYIFSRFKNFHSYVLQYKLLLCRPNNYDISRLLNHCFSNSYSMAMKLSKMML